jgi:type IV secretion system protein TrbJ
MKLSVPTRRKVVLATAVVALIATPGFAFGFIVFDPSVYAQAVTQVRQAIQMVNTAKLSLNMMQANLKSFTFKRLWQTANSAMLNASVRNRYGETNAWNAALNTNSPDAATTAWGMANVAVTPGTYLQGQTPGNSAPLASLAMVEAFDSISPDCLNAVAQYRTLRAQNSAAQANLENQQFDTSADTNTEIEQLNLLNASEAQKMNEIQSQGVLHACLAAQMTVANMAQRNAAATAINNAAYVQQQRATNNTNPDNQSHTWQTYIP